MMADPLSSAASGTVVRSSSGLLRTLLAWTDTSASDFANRPPGWMGYWSLRYAKILGRATNHDEPFSLSQRELLADIPRPLQEALDPAPSAAEPMDRDGALLPWRITRSTLLDFLGPVGIAAGAAAFAIAAFSVTAELFHLPPLLAPVSFPLPSPPPSPPTASSKIPIPNAQQFPSSANPVPNAPSPSATAQPNVLQPPPATTPAPQQPPLFEAPPAGAQPSSPPPETAKPFAPAQQTPAQQTPLAASPNPSVPSPSVAPEQRFAPTEAPRPAARKKDAKPKL